MRLNKLMVVTSTVLCLGLVSCSNSNKEEISLSDLKSSVKSLNEYENYDYSSIKVTATLKDLSVTGDIATLVGDSLKNYVGISQTQVISYKDNYSDYVLSSQTLEILESSNNEKINVLNYKIYKINNKISIEYSFEQSMNMSYGEYSMSYKVNANSVINYDENGFVTSLTMDSTFIYNDSSSITQKNETTVELVK